MNSQFSNTPLFEKKLEILKRLNDRKLMTQSSPVFCNYHGVSLLFQNPTERFKKSLQSFVPESWLRTSTIDFRVTIWTPMDFGMSTKDWSDEASQDCHTEEQNTLAIQRDFAAIVAGQEVNLICDDVVDDGLFNFLRWFLSEKLMAQHRFVIHSSCVLDRHQQAHIFLGHSGAGKSTITSLASPRLVLGDDMNIIGRVDGSLRVWAGAIGGIFNSMIGYENSAPVKSFYWLNQSETHSLVQINQETAIQKLLASFANLNWPTLPNESISKLMDFALATATAAPFYDLQFKKDAEIWQLLDP